VSGGGGASGEIRDHDASSTFPPETIPIVPDVVLMIDR